MWLRWDDTIYHLCDGVKVKGGVTSSGLVCIEIQQEGKDTIKLATSHARIFVEMFWENIKSGSRFMESSNDALTVIYNESEGDKFGDADKVNDDGVVGD
jgi:hypothetical protein